MDISPSWSPDGSKIAFHSNRTGNSEIWIIGADGSNPRQITRNSAEDQFPCFSPDGMRIVFSSNCSGNYDIWILEL